MIDYIQQSCKAAVVIKTALHVRKQSAQRRGAIRIVGRTISLERDSLIRQSGIQRGTRKPHFAYELTDEAEHLFPKAYDALFNQLITALKARLTPRALKEVLREVGRSLVGDRTSGGNLEARVGHGLMALEAIGGSARLEKEEGKLFIRSESCPLSTAVVEHPEVCQLAESLLSEITGAEVREQCERETSPRCSFEVTERRKPG